jgi:putative acetyltransferase
VVAEAASRVTLAEEDPLAADSVALGNEMAAIAQRLYPEDAENGVIPTSDKDLAAKGVLVVARVDDVAAGCGGLMPLDPVNGAAALEVKRVMVRPRYRGGGVAQALMTRLEALARERGAQALVLMCGPRQPEALRLYRRCGFVVRPPYGRHAEHPLSIFLEKRLR